MTIWEMKKRSAVPDRRRSRRWSVGSLVALGVLVTGAGWQLAQAATFRGPTAAPPDGNIPATIWNRLSSIGKQTGAAIDIDGGGPGGTNPVGVSVGTPTLNMGSAAGGDNLFYGVADYNAMHASDSLLKLQVVTSGTNYYQRFTVDRVGTGTFSGDLEVGRRGSFGGTSYNMNASSGGDSLIWGTVREEYMNPADYLLRLRTYSAATASYTDRMLVTRDGDARVAGDLKAGGCFGKTFVGFTVSGGPGSDGRYFPNVGSYYAANQKCADDYPGAHVCRSEEILESISCSAPGDPIRDSAVMATNLAPGFDAAWIQGGPPGYAAMANDCIGWTSVQASAYARVWFFDVVTGGYGTQTSCNSVEPLQMACCL
jgi:hypothetical protein